MSEPLLISDAGGDAPPAGGKPLPPPSPPPSLPPTVVVDVPPPPSLPPTVVVGVPPPPPSAGGGTQERGCLRFIHSILLPAEDDIEGTMRIFRPPTSTGPQEPIEVKVRLVGGGAIWRPVRHVYTFPVCVGVLLVLGFIGGVPTMVSALVMLGLAGFLLFFGWVLMKFFGWIRG